MSEPLHAPELLHRLTGLRFGHPVYLYRQIGSTNDEARRLAQARAPEGLMVVAEAQTAGRGRSGRRWLTPPGSALAFSLVLRPKVSPAQAMRLTMLAGLAVCDAIEQVAGVRVALKWPNDILVAGQKTAGILVETASHAGGDPRLDYAVLGIGINVATAPPAAEVDFPATALNLQAAQPVDRLILLRSILKGLEDGYGTLAAPDPTALHAAWAARLVWLGQRVVVSTAGGPVAGEAESADPDGALVVRVASGERIRVLAGDVRLRQGVP